MASYKVFDPQVVLALAKKHKSTLNDLATIQAELNKRFYDMQTPIQALILAVATGEPLLFIGPPGTAKSRLIRAFCDFVDLKHGSSTDATANNADYFEYLLTPFTEPGELFGYYEIEQNKGRTILNRKKTGKILQNAKVVYLDEVFNASSAILNSLLAIINERFFHDRGEIIPAKWQCLFGATNHIPQASELRAIYDRFLLRCEVRNVADEQTELGSKLTELLAVGWQETYGDPTPTNKYSRLLQQLKNFRQDIIEHTKGPLKIQRDPEFLGQLATRVAHIHRMELSEMSNRRLVKMLHVMLIHSIYEAVRNNRLNQGITFSNEQFNLLRFAQDRRVEELEQALRYQELN